MPNAQTLTPRRPKARLPVPFTMDDLADCHRFASALAPHGVTWSIDVSRADFPEIGTVSLNDVPTFMVWRAANGLRMRDLLVTGDVALSYPTQGRVWAFMTWLMAIPVAVLTVPAYGSVACAVDSLPNWLRE